LGGRGKVAEFKPGDATLFAKRRAYTLVMGTRPQTMYGLADSPVDLAAWMIDHGDGWSQPAAAVTSAVLGRSR
jgi:hypothetical protein